MWYREELGCELGRGRVLLCLCWQVCHGGWTPRIRGRDGIGRVEPMVEAGTDKTTKYKMMTCCPGGPPTLIRRPTVLRSKLGLHLSDGEPQMLKPNEHRGDYIGAEHNLMRCVDEG
jgi:hypothetical protein